MHLLLDQTWLAMTRSRVLIGADLDALPEFAQRLAEEVADLGAARPIIALKVGNDWRSVTALITLLRAGANPLIIADEAPDAEIERALDAVNGHGIFTPGNRDWQKNCALVRRHHASPNLDLSLQAEPGVFLSTSGSTGAPKIVFRSLESWRWEAERYYKLLSITKDDHVLITAPLAHAYALGWLWPSLLHSGALELLPPSALGAVSDAISARATLVALTPTLASLLSRRPRIPRTGDDRKLRVVMAGAGPVDENLDHGFNERFGVPLSRNYGSTETGAVLSGLAPQPTNTVGPPMPNISCILADDEGQHPYQGPGALIVQLEDGTRHDMGDIAECDEQGRYSILGRKAEGLRRGERWVSSAEVANVILRSGFVGDVHVRGASSGRSGNDRLIASVVGKDGASVDLDGLTKFCKANLSAYKVPDLFETVREIPRLANGKIRRKPSYRPAKADRLAAAARAYKISTLLFALSDSGLLDALDGQKNTDIHAVQCGLSPKAVEECLEIAELCGLVERTPEGGSLEPPKQSNFSGTAFIDLERHLFRDLASPKALLKFLKMGLDKRPFETGNGLDDNLLNAYAKAMQGPHRVFARRIALRKLPKPRAVRVLEIGASRGAYISSILNEDEKASGTFVRIGRLCPPEDEELSVFKENGRLVTVTAEHANTASLSQLLGDAPYDTIIIDNAVHGPPPAGDLDALLSHLSPEGALLVDDIFLPPGNDAAIGVDWLTHGGTEFKTTAALHERLVRAGLKIHPVTKINDNTIHSVFFATRGTMQ